MPRSLVLISLEVLPDVHAGIAEQIQRLPSRLAVADAVEDRLGRMPLMYEQRCCRNLDLVPLSLSCPVEERFADSRSFVEIIRVEFAQYIRGDDTPWMKFPGIHGFDSGLEVRGKKNQYRSVPSIGFEGGIADFYERRSSGKFQDPAQMVGVYVKGIKTTRIWYSLDGKILKKLEEIMVKGGNQMSRETTTYEHDPKDLKIEAPVVK